MDLKRRRYVFAGRVQGVGFRWVARTAAISNSCIGWVRNEYNGTVTMEIQGGNDQINEVIAAIYSSSYIRIEDIDIEYLEPVSSEQYQNKFRVL